MPPNDIQVPDEVPLLEVEHEDWLPLLYEPIKDY